MPVSSKLMSPNGSVSGRAALVVPPARWTLVVAAAAVLVTSGCTLRDHGNAPVTVAGGGASAGELNSAKRTAIDAGIAVATEVRGPTIELVKADGQWAGCSNGSNDPKAIYAARAVFLRKADKDTPLQKVDPVAATLVGKGWKITDNASDADLGDVYLAKGDLTAEVLTHGIQQVTVTVSSRCLVSDLIGSPSYQIGENVELQVP